MQMTGDGNTLTMRAPDNWHAHFRQDLLLEFLVQIFIKWGWRHRIVAEPNTLPAKTTGELAIAYGEIIRSCARQIEGGHTLQPVPAMQITEATTAEMMRGAFRRGVRVCKVYPKYVTTHSENGVVNYFKIYPALAVAETVDMVVQFHPEHPSYDVIGRMKEAAFRAILDNIHKTFPRLRISVEHVSSKDMVDWVFDQSQEIGASITIQHLMVTADDLQGYSKRSGGLGCVHDGLFKPCAKDPTDRLAVQAAAFSGNPKFWYGGDDAAHLKSKKECAKSACGAWNTIPALSMLITLFSQHKQLTRLEPFLSEFGARFYGFPLNQETATFIRKKWTVPNECVVPALNDSIVPFYAGEEMEWEYVG